ncbi:MAG: hypothetical protein LBF00_02265 [Mycoplasmataceae bacterium]|jgi:hypothetical protein|nr:hypothetical protein [Mycoplasmataceae bacterium]
MLHNIPISLNSAIHGASSTPTWIWVWLSNLIGSDNAAVVQYVVMILVYGTAIVLIGMQVVRMMHNWSNRNHKDVRIREEAKENIHAGIIIIVVVALIAGIGFSAVCFFLNKFIGQ